MLSFVIFLIFTIFGAGATDEPCHLGHQVIRISGFDWNFPYKVVKGKPLQIHLDETYIDVWCSEYTDSTLNYNVELTYCGSGSIITVKNVTDAMNSKWKCTVKRTCVDEKTNTISNCTFLKHFTIHVMGAIPVNVTINKALVMPVQTTDMAYDGEAKYFYENGQFVDFECSQKQDGNYKLLLNYYNAQGIPLLETRNQINPISFRAYLSSFHINSYIVCIIHPTKEPQNQYHYKTTFVMKETHFYKSQDYIIVSVNGLQLVPMGSNITRTDDLDYEYRFIESEDLNIICQKSNDRIKGKLLYNNTSELDVTTVQSDSNDKLRLKIQTKVTTKDRTLSCGINDDKKLFARILFLDNLPWNEITIFGLPPKNILYEYRSASHQSTIAYQYTVNETLSLTCVKKDSNKIDNSKLQWKFDDNVLDTESIQKNLLLKSTTNITLTEKDNETTIQCIEQLETKNKELKLKVEVIFKLKPEWLPEDNNASLGSGKMDVMTLISIITAAVIIVTVTIVCLICWSTGGTRNVKHPENEYENLSNPGSSPIPSFPNQWENQREDSHNTKIDEGVMIDNPSYAGSTKILYTLPHIRQSASSENHYTEIDDCFKSKTDRLENNLQIDEDISNSRDVGNDMTDLSKRSYVNVPLCRKKKGVTFENVNNKDLRPRHNNKYGQNSNESHNLKQFGTSNYVNEVLQTNYANAFADVQVKAKRENGYRAEQNEENSNYLEYAVPYSCSNEIVNCDNELYNKK